MISCIHISLFSGDVLFRNEQKRDSNKHWFTAKLRPNSLCFILQSDGETMEVRY